MKSLTTRNLYNEGEPRGARVSRKVYIGGGDDAKGIRWVREGVRKGAPQHGNERPRSCSDTTVLGQL